jgi:tetratricopeptide (TPR) repeat protein
MGQGIDTKSGRVIFGIDSVRSGLSQRAEAIEQVRQHVMSAIATRVDPALMAWAGNAGKPPVKFSAYEEFADGMTSFVSGIAEQHGASRGEPRFASAREHLERAFRLDTTYNVAALWLFWARYNVGDRVGADSVLRRLERRRTFMSPYERVLYDYNVALMRGTPEQRFQLDKKLVSFAPASEFLFCLARDALEAGHPADALDVLNRVDDSYSWVQLMPFPRGMLVRALIEQGNHERAVQTAQRLYKEAPSDLTPAYPQIDALAALGRLDDIEQVVEQVSRGATRNGEVGNLMLYAGLRLQSGGRNEQAQRFFAGALPLYGQDEVESASQDAQRGRARSLYYLRRWDDARKAFEHLANAPSNTSTADWRSLLFLGSLAARRGDTAEVSRIRSELHASSMNPAIAQYFEARVAAVAGQRDRALELLATAISLGVLAEEFVMNGDAAPSMDPDFSALRAAPAFRTAVGFW